MYQRMTHEGPASMKDFIAESDASAGERRPLPSWRSRIQHPAHPRHARQWPEEGRRPHRARRAPSGSQARPHVRFRIGTG